MEFVDARTAVFKERANSGQFGHASLPTLTLKVL
jgi:hypothetical protein